MPVVAGSHDKVTIARHEKGVFHMFMPTRRLPFRLDTKKGSGAPAQSKESGQSLAEYTIIMALVGVAAIAGTAYLGTAIKAKISSIAGTVSGASSSEIEAQDELSRKAFRGASESAASVSGMKVETKRGKGREVLDREDIQ
jgi:Flp pilus assembly pilin Flp